MGGSLFSKQNKTKHNQDANGVPLFTVMNEQLQ